MLNLFLFNKSTKIILLTIFLSIIGVLNIFSTTYFFYTEIPREVINQTVFFILGIVILIILSTINSKFLVDNFYLTFVLFFSLLVLLVLVILIGEEVNGVKRWISISGFYIQPSEFSKIIMPIVISYILGLLNFTKKQQLSSSQKKSNINKQTLFRNILISICLVVTASSIIFLIFLQKSLGNTIINLIIIILMLLYYLFNTFGISFLAYFWIGFVAFIFSMIYIITNTNNIAFILVALLIFSILSRSYNKFILISVVSICIVIPFSIKYIYDNVLLDYQRTRIESFLSPTEDLEGSNWQRLQSLRAISNGGVFGKGLFNGDFVNQRMLPFAHTDFAFASLAEQFGLLGSVVLFLAYFWLFSIILNILSEVNNQTNRVAIFGIFLALVVNTMQHIGMNIGMLPITGTTLPFISYGGSSYLSFVFGLGVILSIYNTYISNSKEKMSVVNLRQSIIDQI